MLYRMIAAHSAIRILLPALAVVILCTGLAIGCGAGAGSLNGSFARSKAERAVDSIRIINADSTRTSPAEVLRIKVSDDGGQIVVVLEVAEDLTLSQILYDIEFDGSRLNLQESELLECLGTEEEAIGAIFNPEPGRVAIGQVRIGLSEIQVLAGTPFAKLVLDQGPSKVVSQYSDTSAGLKLRSQECVEFSNADVPFMVTAIDADEGIYEATWEESLDGDFNCDGEAGIADLTPIGQHFGQALDNRYIDDPEHEGRYLLVRQPASEAVQNLAIHTISLEGQPSSNGYCAVDRFDNDAENYGLHTPWSPVTAADITTVGRNIYNQVFHYRIYAVTSVTGFLPTPTNLEGDPVLLATVDRPVELGEKISHLGMGEYNPPGEDYSYEDFCQEVCTGDLERGGVAPVLTEHRMYKKTVQIPEMGLGDVYIVVTPDPGHLGNNMGDTDLGAYTYWPDILQTNEEYPPTSITWQNNEVGLQDIQRGDTEDWPEGTEHQFRISFGYAEFDNPQYYADKWEVRYLVFFSEDPQSLWDTDGEGLPVNKYYPHDDDQAKSMVAVVHPPEWFVFPDKKSMFDRTFYVGVRAYAYKKYTNGKEIYVTGLDLNEVSDNVTLGPEFILEDRSPPVIPGPYWTPSEFEQAWVISDTEYEVSDGDLGTYGDYRCPPLVAGHQKNTNQPDSTGFSQPAAWAPAMFATEPLYDYNEHEPEKRPLNEIELRYEVFRTTLNETQLFAAISKKGGILPWMKSNVTASDVFAVMMTFPDLYLDAGLKYLQANNEIRDDWTWWADDSGNEKVVNTFICPPFLNSVPNWSQYQLDWYANHYPGYEFHNNWNFEWEYCTDQYSIDSQNAWNEFILYEETTKCETGFSLTVQEPFRIVYDEAYESSGGTYYNYFAVMAVSDPVYNCTYSDEILWLGPAPQADTDSFEMKTRDVYEYWLRNAIGDASWYGNDEHFQDKYISSAGLLPSVESRQIRYPDVAYDPTREVLGISHYDPNLGRVALEEVFLQLHEIQVTRVDDASYGDTSLTFDDDGEPHVAYFKLENDQGEPVEQGASHGSSSLDRRTSSSGSGYIGGIKYRHRDSGAWDDVEDVDDKEVLNDAEHDIHIDASGTPFCIIPTTDDGDIMWELGIPGCAERGGFDWAVDALGTPEYITNLYLDSITAVNGPDTITYVAYYSPLEQSLSLGTLINQQGWNTVQLACGDVRGYPCIIELPSGNLGISYMATDENSLRYGEWDGASFTLLYATGLPGCGSAYRPERGYQSALSYDPSGKPIIYSLTASGTLLCTKFTGSEWVQFGITQAHAGALMAENTISVARVAGGDYIVFISPLGTRGLVFWAYL